MRYLLAGVLVLAAVVCRAEASDTIQVGMRREEVEKVLGKSCSWMLLNSWQYTVHDQGTDWLGYRHRVQVRYYANHDGAVDWEEFVLPPDFELLFARPFRLKQVLNVLTPPGKCP